MRSSPVVDRAVPRPLLAPMWCGAPTARSRRTRRCNQPAGKDTLHPGFGPCVTHQPAGMARAWRLAVTTAEELGVSPWDSLLLSVTLTSEHVLRTERDYEAARAANDGDPAHPDVQRLAAASRAERRLLAHVSQAALAAGFGERLVQQREFEGRVLADALDAALAAIGAPPEARVAALSAAHRSLLSLGAVPSATPTIPGVIVSPDDDSEPEGGPDLESGPI